MNAKELRELWNRFFIQQGHKMIGSASLVPENDPSVLFTTAGMHPLVPYLLGEKHPAGTRLANVQRCVRTGDIDEVGDNTHFTFFEMLGNWSLGDYGKDEAIKLSFTFLTGKEWLNLPLEKLAFTCFAGDAQIPKDTEAAEAWKACGVKDSQIYFLGKSDNWWGLASGTGPCGPDSEMFVRVKDTCSKSCNPACKCGAFVEIWNDVFMQYTIKTPGAQPERLPRMNIDTGMGLERTLAIINNLQSGYDTDLFAAAKKKLEELSGKKMSQDKKESHAMRVILDHSRAAFMMLGDPVQTVPSNVGRGYVLRRLIRRAYLKARALELPAGALAEVAASFALVYNDIYPEVTKNIDFICDAIHKEEEKFAKTLEQGLKEFNKLIENLIRFAPENKKISGDKAFKLFDTYGFPLEITEELAREKGFTVDQEGFNKAFDLHREKSGAGTTGLFKGGLAGSGEQTAKLHTATHLLHYALSQVLQAECKQMGSNITAERLRFDFAFDRKLTEDEIKKTEDIVNEAIQKALPVVCEEMSVAAAKAKGAVGIFDAKYGNQVKVYAINGYGAEICGGPHAQNTQELKKFTIVKEESSSGGVRRIKGVLEN